MSPVAARHGVILADLVRSRFRPLLTRLRNRAAASAAAEAMAESKRLPGL